MLVQKWTSEDGTLPTLPNMHIDVNMYVYIYRPLYIYIYIRIQTDSSSTYVYMIAGVVIHTYSRACTLIECMYVNIHECMYFLIST